MNYDVKQPLPYTADGKDIVLTGPETITVFAQQEIRVILETFRGQYIYDADAGTDWLEILDQVPIYVVREHVRRAILKATSISTVDSIQAYPEPDRSLRITFTATTTQGTPLTGEELI